MKKKVLHPLEEPTLRPLGQVTDDLEPLLVEMAEGHEMQVHEILGIIYMYLQVHCPDSIERYEDGTTPILSYKHRDE